MPIAYTSVIEAELATDVWTDISEDVRSDVYARYGIDGNGPMDVMADAGELRFDLDNSAQNSGSTLGYYSPNHASVRSGWTYGKGIRWVLTHNVAASVSSITRSGSTATATTAAAHGLATNDWVKIAGADQSAYNGHFKITVTGATTFTYAVSGTPATPATGTITWMQVYVRFNGFVNEIEPVPGQYRERRARVLCNDSMRGLIYAPAREVTVQVDKTETELITALLDALPTIVQPPSRSLATGLDTYPFAFDDLGAGTGAGAVIRAIVQSGLGIFYASGDGTATYKTRHDRAKAASAMTLVDADIIDIRVPSSSNGALNRVRATIHPKTIDAAATTVLWAQTGEAPKLRPGEPQTVWGSYYDPSDPTRSIGGTAQVAPVATTDYTANAAADGSGVNLTADLAVTATAFASTVKFVLTNNHVTSDAYVTKLQIRGKGVYDNGPRTFESFVAVANYDHTFVLDMPYQDDAAVGQSAADYVRQQFDTVEDQIEEVAFIASATSAKFLQAMTREPGDVITVSETMTGLVSVEVAIQAVELTMHATRELRCRYEAVPGAPFKTWLLGTAGASELGTTTFLGF